MLGSHIMETNGPYKPIPLTLKGSSPLFVHHSFQKMFPVLMKLMLFKALLVDALDALDLRLTQTIGGVMLSLWSLHSFLQRSKKMKV